MTPVVELSEQAKLRLVTHLARFSGPSEAARLVSSEFGVTLTRAQAGKYDPTRPDCRISPRLKQVFFEIRERWLNRMSEIGVANKGYRLRALGRLATRLEEKGDYLGALKALEQAAHEVGGLFEKQAPPSKAEPVATEFGHGGHEVNVATLRQEVEERLRQMINVGGEAGAVTLNRSSASLS